MNIDIIIIAILGLFVIGASYVYIRKLYNTTKISMELAYRRQLVKHLNNLTAELEFLKDGDFTVVLADGEEIIRLSNKVCDELIAWHIEEY